MDHLTCQAMSSTLLLSAVFVYQMLRYCVSDATWWDDYELVWENKIIVVIYRFGKDLVPEVPYFSCKSSAFKTKLMMLVQSCCKKNKLGSSSGN